MLNCSLGDARHFLALVLRPLQGDEHKDEYIWVGVRRFVEWKPATGRCLGRRSVYVRQLNPPSISHSDLARITLLLDPGDSNVYVECNFTHPGPDAVTGFDAWDEVTIYAAGTDYTMVSRKSDGGDMMFTVLVRVFEVSTFLVVVNFREGTAQGAHIEADLYGNKDFKGDYARNANNARGKNACFRREARPGSFLVELDTNRRSSYASWQRFLRPTDENNLDRVVEPRSKISHPFAMTWG